MPTTLGECTDARLPYLHTLRQLDEGMQATAATMLDRSLKVAERLDPFLHYSATKRLPRGCTIPPHTRMGFP